MEGAYVMRHVTGNKQTVGTSRAGCPPINHMQANYFLSGGTRAD